MSENNIAPPPAAKPPKPRAATTSPKNGPPIPPLPQKGQSTESFMKTLREFHEAVRRGRRGAVRPVPPPIIKKKLSSSERIDEPSGSTLSAQPSSVGTSAASSNQLHFPPPRDIPPPASPPTAESEASSTEKMRIYEAGSFSLSTPSLSPLPVGTPADSPAEIQLLPPTSLGKRCLRFDVERQVLEFYYKSPAGDLERSVSQEKRKYQSQNFLQRKREEETQRDAVVTKTTTKTPDGAQRQLQGRPIVDDDEEIQILSITPGSSHPIQMPSQVPRSHTSPPSSDGIRRITPSGHVFGPYRRPSALGARLRSRRVFRDDDDEPRPRIRSEMYDSEEEAEERKRSRDEEMRKMREEDEQNGSRGLWSMNYGVYRILKKYKGKPITPELQAVLHELHGPNKLTVERKILEQDRRQRWEEDD